MEQHLAPANIRQTPYLLILLLMISRLFNCDYFNNNRNKNASQGS